MAEHSPMITTLTCVVQPEIAWRADAARKFSR
jgi:hypothetical protein